MAQLFKHFISNEHFVLRIKDGGDGNSSDKEDIIGKDFDFGSDDGFAIKSTTAVSAIVQQKTVSPQEISMDMLALKRFCKMHLDAERTVKEQIGNKEEILSKTLDRLFSDAASELNKGNVKEFSSKMTLIQTTLEKCVYKDKSNLAKDIEKIHNIKENAQILMAQSKAKPTPSAPLDLEQAAKKKPLLLPPTKNSTENIIKAGKRTRANTRADLLGSSGKNGTVKVAPKGNGGASR